MERIARISLTSGHAVKEIKLLEKIRWKCIDCGKCCELGAPNLSKKDQERLEKVEQLKPFIVPLKNRSTANLTDFSLKSRKSGHCYFLFYEKGKSRCAIHPFRPTLCDLFPFYFEQKGDTLFLFALPCLGLGKGDDVNEKFIKNLLKNKDLYMK